MDRSAPATTRKKIRALTLSVEGVSGTGLIRTRRVGKNLWVDLDILVSPRCSVERASQIADDVKGCLLRKAKHVEEVVVYCHPNDGRGRLDATAPALRPEGGI